MVFSSIVFLGLFLPITFLAYYLTPERWRNTLLVAASIVFYAWGEPRYILLMLLSVSFNFHMARKIDSSETRREFLLGVAIVLNLTLLGIFKYGNFVIDNLNSLYDMMGVPPLSNPHVTLPIGISFYTFHAISYLMDIYRRNTRANNNIVDYSLYIMLFPQLVAGPIIRYKDIYKQLTHRETTLDDLNAGIYRFTIGLAKKVLIANQLGIVADAGFNAPADQLTMAVAWLCLVCYALQLYFDFSGYSDMAIGLARMFGFRFPENFNYPYAATSIQDFWRRWHISLSTWFRDYVYIPLGGNRHGGLRTLINLWIVFLLTGLWHGASWNFVLWGAMHGFFLSLERLLRDVPWSPPMFLRRLYLILVVTLAWVFFRAITFDHSLDYYRALTGFWPTTDSSLMMADIFSVQIGVVLVIAIVLAGGLYPALQQRAARMWESIVARSLDGYIRAAVVVGLLIPCVMSIALGQYNPFIYFRF